MRIVGNLGVRSAEKYAAFQERTDCARLCASKQANMSVQWRATNPYIKQAHAVLDEECFLERGLSTSPVILKWVSLDLDSSRKNEMFTDSAWHLAKIYLLPTNAYDKDLRIPLVDSTFVFQCIFLLEGRAQTIAIITFSGPAATIAMVSSPPICRLRSSTHSPCLAFRAWKRLHIAILTSGKRGRRAIGLRDAHETVGRYARTGVQCGFSEEPVRRHTLPFLSST
jgi:hypothetical protein